MLTTQPSDPALDLLEEMYEMFLRRLADLPGGESDARTEEVIAQAVASICMGMLVAADLPVDIASGAADHAAALAGRLRARIASGKQALPVDRWVDVFGRRPRSRAAA